MERTYATVDGAGLQIPLQELQQFGITTGSQVTIEFEQNRIMVTLPITAPQKIEDRALRLTLRHLGDAAKVKAELDTQSTGISSWKVGVYKTDSDSPLGHLFFSHTGEFLPERSTRFELMRAQ